MPSDGGLIFWMEGREEVADFKESVSMVRRAGSVAGAAMLGYLETRLMIFATNL